MRLRSFAAGSALALAILAIPAAGSAHTKAVASTPAQGASVERPRSVALTFNEALLPPTATASIVMTAVPGMKNHGEMAIRNFTNSWSDKNRTMTLKLRQPLRAGSYDVRW